MDPLSLLLSPTPLDTTTATTGTTAASLRLLDTLIDPLGLAARPHTRPRYVAESTDHPQPTHKIDRKLAVRACRVLRLQIKAFEDAFAETSKRRPRGSDRRPLASTYRQYRDWKRCIRHDAAAAIQGLCRRRRARPMVSAPRPAIQTSTIAQLRLDKRNIKKKLRAYDAQFVAKHGRSPTRFEKEPIRGLYELYYSAKERLRKLGNESEDNSS
jgi:hypothetical protein